MYLNCCAVFLDIVSILGRSQIYPISLKGKWLYLIVYRELSPNQDNILFVWINIINLCIVLQDRVILDEWILRIP